MISFLTSAKAFRGRTGDNQRNAIRSWLGVHPEAEVIVYGATDGAEAVCRELGARCYPEIDGTLTGVPYFDAIAGHAERHAKFNTQAYVNCDIVLTPAIVSAVRRAPSSDYLMIGQRIDLQEMATWEAGSADWLPRLSKLAGLGLAVLHEPTGVDYFVFPRGLWRGLKPLIIGRGGYDGALIAYALGRRVPVIDATLKIAALHQYHDYGHVAGGVETAHRGAEARENFKRHRITYSPPNCADAQWRIIDGALVSDPSRGDWLRALEMRVRFVHGLNSLGLLVRGLWRLTTASGIYQPRQLSLSEVLDAYRRQAALEPACDPWRQTGQRGLR